MSKQSVQPGWLTVRQAAIYLQVGHKAIYKAMSTGRLRYFWTPSGRRRRLRKEDLDAALTPGETGQKGGS